MAAKPAAVPQIGPLLQRRRKSRGLTLEQLARQSGVSKSMLSQVERGKANPTFAVLWSLTQALAIDLADLVAAGPGESDAIEVVDAGGTPEIRSADGMCRLRILSPPRRAGDVEWYEVEIAPGGRLASGAHAPGSVEHFTALTAGFEVTSGSTTRVLKAGETARYRVDVPHSLANLGRRAARGFMVVLYR